MPLAGRPRGGEETSSRESFSVTVPPAARQRRDISKLSGSTRDGRTAAADEGGLTTRICGLSGQASAPASGAGSTEPATPDRTVSRCARLQCRDGGVRLDLAIQPRRSGSASPHQGRRRRGRPRRRRSPAATGRSRLPRLFVVQQHRASARAPAASKYAGSGSISTSTAAMAAVRRASRRRRPPRTPARRGSARCHRQREFRSRDRDHAVGHGAVVAPVTTGARRGGARGRRFLTRRSPVMRHRPCRLTSRPA